MATTSNDFNQFFEDVEDLVKRVADVTSPEIQKIRAKVRAALIAARNAAKDGAASAQRRAREVAGSTDELVREYPWVTIGAAVLVGIGIGAGIAAGRRG